MELLVRRVCDEIFLPLGKQITRPLVQSIYFILKQLANTCSSVRCNIMVIVKDRQIKQWNFADLTILVMQKF